MAEATFVAGRPARHFCVIPRQRPNTGPEKRITCNTRAEQADQDGGDRRDEGDAQHLAADAKEEVVLQALGVHAQRGILGQGRAGRALPQGFRAAQGREALVNRGQDLRPLDVGQPPAR